MELAVNEVKKARAGEIADERKRARATFEVIARTLRAEGYRHRVGDYPHTLTAVLSSPSKLFDCDTGSFIFLSVAEVLNLPVSMVEVEVAGFGPARAFGDHNFVRWTLGDGSTVDWDPNDERERSGDKKTKLYGYAWSRDQLIGYLLFSRGLDWEKVPEFNKALADYESSLKLFPVWPKAKNNIAWLIASRKELQGLGREKEALALAQEVVAVHPTANNRDTLACAYALNGDFASAIRIQEKVVKENEEEPSFAANLRRMRQGKNCFVDNV
jgi:hypothetical protein